MKRVQIQAPQVPLLRMNGTGGKSLSEQLDTAVRAVATAQDALRDAWPHMRDYYPLPADAWKRAESEAVARLGALDKVRLELTVILAAVLDQIDAREMRRGTL